MEINVRVLKREILEKAVAYTNSKLGIQLEILAFKKESKYGEATLSSDNLTTEKAFKVGMLLSERIQLITDYRWER